MVWAVSVMVVVGNTALPAWIGHYGRWAAIGLGVAAATIAVITAVSLVAMARQEVDDPVAVTYEGQVPERSGAPARVFCAWCGSEEPGMHFSGSYTTAGESLYEGPPCPLYPTDAVCPKCGNWHDFPWEGWS